MKVAYQPSLSTLYIIPDSKSLASQSMTHIGRVYSFLGLAGQLCHYTEKYKFYQPKVWCKWRARTVYKENQLWSIINNLSVI